MTRLVWESPKRTTRSFSRRSFNYLNESDLVIKNCLDQLKSRGIHICEKHMVNGESLDL